MILKFNKSPRFKIRSFSPVQNLNLILIKLFLFRLDILFYLNIRFHWILVYFHNYSKAIGKSITQLCSFREIFRLTLGARAAAAKDFSSGERTPAPAFRYKQRSVDFYYAYKIIIVIVNAIWKSVMFVYKYKPI